MNKMHPDGFHDRVIFKSVAHELRFTPGSERVVNCIHWGVFQSQIKTQFGEFIPYGI